MVKKLLLLLLFVASMVSAQGRPFKIVNPDVDSAEVVDLKNLFNSLVHDLNEQLENQGRFAPGRIADKTASFNDQIVSLETLRDALNNQDLRAQLQEQIEAVKTLRDDLTRPRGPNEVDGRWEKSEKAPAIIERLNQQLNDVDRALKKVE